MVWNAEENAWRAYGDFQYADRHESGFHPYRSVNLVIKFGCTSALIS
jgi:hypothetical protein